MLPSATLFYNYFGASDSVTYPDRGFEWYYLQRQTHQALKTFHGHTASIWSLALSPDRRKLVTGSEDMTAKVWDLATGGTAHAQGARG
jgi:WD40 repeat protein